jgi:hypothetical protein
VCVSLVAQSIRSDASQGRVQPIDVGHPARASRVSGAVRPSALELTNSSQTVGRGEFLFATSWSLLPCEYLIHHAHNTHADDSPRSRGSSQFRAIESMTPSSLAACSLLLLLLLGCSSSRGERKEMSLSSHQNFRAACPKIDTQIPRRHLRRRVVCACCYFYRGYLDALFAPRMEPKQLKVIFGALRCLLEWRLLCVARVPTHRGRTPLLF